MNIESGSLERQAIFQFLRPFDIPDTEYFADILQTVLITVCCIQCSIFFFIANAAGNDPVYQGRAE